MAAATEYGFGCSEEMKDEITPVGLWLCCVAREGGYDAIAKAGSWLSL